MQTVELFTRDGEPVTEVTIPVFDPPAEILLWGTRYFVWDNANQQYREGMAYFVSQERGSD